MSKTDSIMNDFLAQRKINANDLKRQNTDDEKYISDEHAKQIAASLVNVSIFLLKPNCSKAPQT